MTEQTMDPQRGALYGTLRTLRGAAVALQLAEHRFNERLDLEAQLIEANRAEGELDFVLAGAIAALLRLCDFVAETTTDPAELGLAEGDHDGITTDDLLAILRAHTAQHMKDTIKQLKEIGS